MILAKYLVGLCIVGGVWTAVVGGWWHWAIIAPTAVIGLVVAKAVEASEGKRKRK